MKSVTLAFAGVFCFCLSVFSFADTLNMPKESADTQSVPKRGMTKEQVESGFGSPDSKHGPRGTPPIYYWEYPSYTVYFESNYVLHTVIKQRSKAHSQAN